MLLGLHKQEYKNLALESSQNSALPSDSANSSWKETPDDVVTAGSQQWMNHQQRVEWVRNRTYSPVKPSETQDSE